MIHRLNLKQLDAFRAVMIAGSTADAAQLLNISQPAVSRALQNFEASVEYPLFERRNGRLFPTPEAERLFLELDKLYSSFDHITNVMKRIQPASDGHISIVASTPTAQRFLPEAFAAFQERRPNVSISLRIVVKRETRKCLESQEFDLAILSLPVDYPTANVRHLVSVDGVAILPEAHPLAARETIHAADFEREKFISIVPDTVLRARVDGAFKSHGIERTRMFLETQSGASICQMVRAGMGVSVIDPFNAQAFGDVGLAIRPFSPRVRFDYGMVFPLNARTTPLALEFSELLSERTKSLDMTGYSTM